MALSGDEQTHGIASACRYLSPEVLNSDYSQLEKADVFALGATMYQLATGVDLPTGKPPHARQPHLLCTIITFKDSM